MSNNNRNAARAAATHGKITLTHEGKTYTISPAESWSLDTLEAFEDGKVITAARSILGERQWATYKGQKPRDGKQFGELLEAISRAVGIQGN
jgi:hypothetical protein